MGLVGGEAAHSLSNTVPRVVVFFFSFSCMNVLSLGFRPGVRSVHQTRIVHMQRSCWSPRY